MLFRWCSTPLILWCCVAAAAARPSASRTGEPRLDEADAEDFFSWSLGGGVHLRADKRVGVRLEARVFGTLIDNDGSLFCVVSPTVNSCAISVEGDQLYQFEARVGVVGRF